MTEKLLAEWFWIDRWMGSSAFLLPMEARGVYREMLTQAWRRGAQLPNDHEAIRRAIGATLKEWRRSWPLIERFWNEEDGFLVNGTQQQVYADAKVKQENASTRGKKGAQAKHERYLRSAQAEPEHSVSTTQEVLKDKPLSLSPEREEERRTHSRETVLSGSLPREHLNHGWCSSRGKCVPTFLHQQFIAAVGGDPQATSTRLKMFYAAVEAGWSAGPIGDAPVKLWEKEFAAKFPSVAPRASMEAPRRPLPTVDDLRKQHERKPA